MVSFAETPRDVVILDESGKPLTAGDHARRFFEASWMHKYNGTYYFSYSTGDTHFIVYATGDVPYGPFTYRGKILEPVLGWTNHHSIVEFKGKWYLFYHDAQLSGGQTHLRNIKMTELKYRTTARLLPSMRTRSDPAGEMFGQGRSPSVVRLVGILLLASVATWFCASRVFWTFDAARIKMLRGPIAAVDGSVEVPAQDDEFKLLAAPAALIARVRNQSDAVQSFAFQVDGAPSCTVKVPAMTERRIDCSARAGFAVQSRHIVKIRGAPVPWTLEYLELASHHGHTTDLLRAIVLPAGSQQFRSPPALLLALPWIGLVLLLRITPEPFSSRAGRRAYLVGIAAVALVGVAIAVLPWLSPYLVVISPATFAAAALLSGLPQLRTLAIKATPVGRGLMHAWIWASAHQPAAAATLAIATTLATGLYGGRAIGGSDEYGYTSQAELWLKGKLEVEQPFVEHAPFADAAQDLQSARISSAPLEADGHRACVCAGIADAARVDEAHRRARGDVLGRPCFGRTSGTGDVRHRAPCWR